MKKYVLALCLFLIVAALTMSLAACSAFTKADAKDVGSLLARASLDYAVAHASGEKVNLKEAAKAVGLQVASAATLKVAGNLNDQGKPTAAAIATAAGQAAELLITEAALNDPATRAKAQKMAADAVLAALERLNGASGAVTAK